MQNSSDYFRFHLFLTRLNSLDSSADKKASGVAFDPPQNWTANFRAEDLNSRNKVDSANIEFSSDFPLSRFDGASLRDRIFPLNTLARQKSGKIERF